MSGFVWAAGPCFACKRVFYFNPNHVPSIRVRGEREPVCVTCMGGANRKREAMGLTPHPIHPDAYQPMPEHEL